MSIVSSRPQITLQRAILGALAVAMLAGFVPASMLLDRRLGAALEDRARMDLTLAPRILADRLSGGADAMMMHAKELSHVPGLARALASANRASALQAVEAERAGLGGSDPVIVGPNGASWSGPTVDSMLVAETRSGHMPVSIQRSANMIHRVALAPVHNGDTWVGAAGLSSAFDDRAAATLASLTRSGVVIITAVGARTGSTLDSATTATLMESASTLDSVPRLINSAAGPLLVVAAPLPGAGMVLFSRSLSDELAVLPELRRVATLAALGALLIALILGAALAARVGRPVRLLSDAASALADERFTAPLPTSAIREVSRVSATFDVMRRSLAARLEELRNTNDALTDRNARLTALQAELMQRDRLAATGRLVTQLAHEIRNPVANLRNCLELIRRRVAHDVEAREFADLAIDELLRMHELAEQMLDVNRPRAPGARAVRPLLIAQEVARLANVGVDAGGSRIAVHGDESATAIVDPDTLKQILMNLVQNAREAHAAIVPHGYAGIEVAVGQHDGVWIEVRDRGPGISVDLLERIFDPFFTTKDAMHGVGLGLFVAEGLVRGGGGHMSVANRDGVGACFRLEYPAISPTMPAHDAAVVMTEA